jgi:hypothetical protein
MCSDTVKVVYFFWSSTLNMGTDVGKPFLISPDSWNLFVLFQMGWDALQVLNSAQG